jgi:hypothetical protein
MPGIDTNSLVFHTPPRKRTGFSMNEQFSALEQTKATLIDLGIKFGPQREIRLLGNA